MKVPPRDELMAFIQSAVTSALALPVLVRPDEDLFELGMDSIDAVELTATIEARFSVAVDPTLVFEEATPRTLAAAICDRQG